MGMSDGQCRMRRCIYICSRVPTPSCTPFRAPERASDERRGGAEQTAVFSPTAKRSPTALPSQHSPAVHPHSPIAFSRTVRLVVSRRLTRVRDAHVCMQIFHRTVPRSTCPACSSLVLYPTLACSCSNWHRRTEDQSSTIVAMPQFAAVKQTSTKHACTKRTGTERSRLTRFPRFCDVLACVHDLPSRPRQQQSPAYPRLYDPMTHATTRPRG